MLAMVLYPDVMKRAQAEIDSVVGRDRMPTFADEPHLPYVRAMVKEILRWRPVGPLGEYDNVHVLLVAKYMFQVFLDGYTR